MADFAAWENSVIGQKVDVDGWYGDQCVDVSNSWAEFCFPGHDFSELLGVPANAKDLLDTANPAYFERLSAGIPRQGDIFVYNSVPGNPYGHTGVVKAADASHMDVIEQNGFNPAGVAYYMTRLYNSELLGYLRPRTTAGEENEVINSKEILDALYLRFRDRYPTQEEYDKYLGKETYANLIPTLNQGNEADALSHEAVIGKIAVRDNWEQQIRDGLAEIEDLQKKLAKATDQPVPPPPTPLPVPTPDPKPTPPPAKQTWFSRLLDRLFGKK